MAFKCLTGLLFLWVISVNEAATLRLFSKQEVMKNMTTSAALSNVLKMEPHPSLVSVMTKHFRFRTNLRARQAPAATGYGAVGQAKDMLNEMITETNKKLDVESVQCDSFERQQKKSMEELRGDVGTSNAAAAQARNIVLDAQAQIIELGQRIPATKNSLEEHVKQCADDIAGMKTELKIVKDDIQVVGSILESTDCNKDPAMMLMQCEHCATGKRYVRLHHRHMGKVLRKLKSPAARQYVQQGLEELYAESAAEQEPVAFTLEDSEEALAEDPQTASALFPPNQLNTSDVPEEVQTKGCVKTNKCSLATNPNCENLQDRFMKVEGGIIDMEEELEQKLSDRESDCEVTSSRFKKQISSLETMHNSELARLAEGTKKQVEAERQSHEASTQHKAVESSFHKRMKSCCDNKNQFLSEICALEKIRGELLKMKGEDVFLQDCEVTDWVRQPCSVSCGGGKMVSTRTVTLEPKGGAVCPALRLEEDCGMDPCPVDCILDDWSGWSSCSAECGGGVMERQRLVRREAQHNGEPCGETIESISCNVQSCDADCELSDWSPWSSCDKACGGGVQTRYKREEKPVKGEGFCPEAGSDERYEEKSCNKFSCAILAPSTTLMCKSTLDLVILLDGSASLGNEGWEASKAAAKQILDSAKGGDVNVALLLFSGPAKWSSFKKCAWGMGTPDLEADCSMKWVSKFKKPDEVSPLIESNMVWPRRTTLTSMALSLARQELTYGRRNTRSAVLVITDGKPMRKRPTRIEARRLQKVAQVTWVLVGPGAPSKRYVKKQKWASKPYKKNIVQVPTFKELTDPLTLSTIVSDLCPVVG